VSSFPVTRLRRFRRTSGLRALVRETRLELDDFVMPLFIGPEPFDNPELPGLARHSVETVAAEADELVGRGVKAVILFGIPDEKDEEGSGAWDDDGVVQRALRALQRRDFVLITDVCLCEYTSHGHCGVLDGDEVDNDRSLPLLAEAALAYAEAGADVVAPSAMMDGQVGALRAALNAAGRTGTVIMAYASKHASALYGPFREAAGSAPAFGDRRSYQMDAANGREALREMELDAREGADILMVKPAITSLDLLTRARARFDLPLAAYQVSGEYAMLAAAAERGWLDRRAAALETLTAIARAGATVIMTYLAADAARWLAEDRP
jgi:porphobilinogen synthase